LLFVFLPLILSCQNHEKDNSALENKSCYYEDKAIDKVFQVKEIQELSKSIEKETNGKHGASALIYDQDSIKYYLRIGINGKDNFQTYYLFNVNKNTCEITVENQLSGREFSLKEWQIKNKKYLTGDVNAFEDNIEDKENCYFEEQETKEKKKKLPYNDKIDIETIKYNTLNCQIEGIDNFLCGEQSLRYIPLPSKEDIKVILVPLDCGDFPYRFYMLTIKNSRVTDKLYVEGEWYEPGSNENNTLENTSFSIDKNYIISVATKKINEKNLIQKYKINNEGKFEEIK
jgi:hypothetical protein